MATSKVVINFKLVNICKAPRVVLACCKYYKNTCSKNKCQSVSQIVFCSTMRN